VAGRRTERRSVVEAKMLKAYIKWLLWTILAVAFGYWWAWEAVGGSI